MSDEKGFLTDRDVEFLRNQGEYYTGENAKQQRYETRETIAARTRQAFRDFSLLYATSDEHERNRIFGVDEWWEEIDAMNEFKEALVDTIAFLYRSLEGEADSDASYYRSFSMPFRGILRQGVAKAEVDRQRYDLKRARVTVDFGVESKPPETVDPSHAIDKIATFREHELTDAEIRALIFDFNPGAGFPNRGYEELEARVQERREELGVVTNPDSLPEEERRKKEEEWGNDTADPDDEE